MEITDEIKTEASEIDFTQEQKDDLFMQLVRGKDITEKVKTKYGVFTVKYPKQKDLIQIGRLAAYKHNGLKAHCFDEDTEASIRITSYLEICVIDGEAWYKNARKEKKNWSWEDVPDTEFLSELYVKAQEFRHKVAETFTGSAEEKAAGVPTDTGSDDNVGEGLFSGFAGSTES